MSIVILRSEKVPDTLCIEYLRCWIHRPAKMTMFFCYNEIIEKQ